MVSLLSNRNDESNESLIVSFRLVAYFVIPMRSDLMPNVPIGIKEIKKKKMRSDIVFSVAILPRIFDTSVDDNTDLFYEYKMVFC